MIKPINWLKPAVLTLLIIMLFSQCSRVVPSLNLSEPLQEVFNIASAHSINRMNIDWESLRMELEDQEAQIGYEAALRLLLRTLGDNHSFYSFSDGRSISESEIRCSDRPFSFANLPDDVGYVYVGAFSGNSQDGRDLANSIQESIRNQDVAGLKGWVVDLSNNGGGNMYPMIAGLGPFYRQEVLGHFVDPQQIDVDWGYSENGSFVNGSANKVVQVDAPYQLKNPGAKVVVTVSNRTASSGEAALISFLGRENTLVLGRASCGLSTANRSFQLTNGDRFVLTVSTMADRNLKSFGGQIIPDEVVRNDQEMLERIIEWLDD